MNSEASKPSLAENQYKDHAFLVIFVTALGLTLLNGGWLSAARAGWMLLAILFSIRPIFGFYAIFFYFPWFHPTEFFPNPFFSLKHFQIAAILSMIVHALNDNLLKTFKDGIKNSASFYYPWFLLLSLGFFNHFRFLLSEQALMTPLNLSAIILTLIYLRGRFSDLEAKKLDTTALLRNSLVCFLAGSLLQVCIAFQNEAAGTAHFKTYLFNNNHLGILCVFSALFSIGLLMSERDFFIKKILYVVVFLFIAALIAACSRTAWISFLIGISLFFIELKKRHRSPHFSGFKRRQVGIVVLFILASGYFLASHVDLIRDRFSGILWLFDWKYWAYTFTDTQNFGFLGYYRLQQIYRIKDILAAEPFLGIGFIKEIMDFHGFHFCVLGASGLLGASVFVYFIRSTILKSLGFLGAKQIDASTFYIFLAAFCSFIAWLIISFLETHIHQFYVWLIFWVLALALTGSPGRSSDTKV